MKQTIIGVIIALIAVIFAIQNSMPVAVKFISWELNCSLALLLIILLAVGIATGMLLLTPLLYRKNVSVKTVKKQIAELEKQLSSLTNQKLK